jgi:ketosteroid isomerase-like protein
MWLLQLIISKAQKMNKLTFIFISTFLFLLSCNTKPDKIQLEKWKNEIRETEHNFSNMAVGEGIHKAFTTFAAEDAVLMRNNELIEGIKNIDKHFKNQNSKGLSWSSDFVDVAASGDLGYTYGHYIFSYIDSTGKSVADTGIFHTVWKRQADGTWRFVWD